MIGPARISDAEMILKVQYLSYQVEAERYDDYLMPPLVESLWTLLSRYDTATILVARTGDEVIGSVRGHMVDEVCEVGRLSVHPRFQQQGIARQHLFALEDACPAACYTLFTGHRSDNNLRLYTGMGYREVRREPVDSLLTFVHFEKRR